LAPIFHDAQSDAQRSALRFSNVDALDLHPFDLQCTSDDEQAEIWSDQRAQRKIGRLILRTINCSSATPFRNRCAGPGYFSTLERALIEHEDLVRKHFMTQPAALVRPSRRATSCPGPCRGFIYVPRAVELDLPIEIFHWLVVKHRGLSTFASGRDEMSKIT